MKESQILFSAPVVSAILAGTKSQTRRVVKLPKELAAGDLSRAWPDKMFGVTTGLHIPMPDESVQRLRNPWGWPEPSRLWVRETFCLENTYDYHGDHVTPVDGRPVQKHESADGSYWLIPYYRATEPEPHIVPYRCDADDDKTRWTPSIFMPRWASRITLEITDVRVERLQDISEVDAKAEGVESPDVERYERDWSICPRCGGTRLYDAIGENYGVIHDTDCLSCDTYSKRYRHLWESINGPGSWDINPFVWVIEFRRIEVPSHDRCSARPYEMICDDMDDDD